MNGYFFQPRALSHNGFIAAADWFRRIHEAAANDDDKEKTAEGSAENDDDDCAVYCSFQNQTSNTFGEGTYSII